MPYENGYVPPRTVEYGQLIYPVKKTDEMMQSRSKGIGPFTTSDNFSEEMSQSENLSKSIGPFSVLDMFSSSRSNLQNAATANSGVGPFTTADNSRSSNAKLIDYIKRINDQEHRKDYLFGGGRTPKDIGSTQQIQRRMLINPGNTYFPPSSRYSGEKIKSNDAPIYQYAHPEFGLQSVGSSSSTTSSSASFEEAKNNHKPLSNYYTHPQYQPQPQQLPQQQQHQQRLNNNGPVQYQIEPALNTREYYNSYPKSPAAMYPQYSQNVNNNNNNNNYAYVRRRQPEQPFWMKISEQFRDTFQNGFAQVHQMAKPVMDPIMEAGEKISQNLGFTHPVQQHAQEKVGVYVPNGSGTSGSSYIFPAIGMLAGGAALGLGAVAMGRIFDVSTLLSMRSSEESSLDFDQKRALDAIRRFPTTTLYLVDNENNNIIDGPLKKSLERSSVPSTYATSFAQQPKANFYEVIAIHDDKKQSSSSQIDNINSSIDPVTHAQSSESIASHQRRKRNK